MAVVSSSPGPLLLLDGDLKVVGASASFCDIFEIDAAAAPGCPIFDLGVGEWNVPQLRSLLATILSGAAKIEAYEMDLRRPGSGAHRVVIHAQKLVYLDQEATRLLVAVSDVTSARADARLMDEALRENLVLLQEVRHRVANSLQIIASVLLQNARKTASDETRGHLTDAHNRVMSVAALERQLTESSDGQVELHAYFTKLCSSIAASMIAGEAHLSLAAVGPEGTVDARLSVSLGLIVTELVINALKHAYPDGRTGRILVDWELRKPNWSLTVSDDGVGMPTKEAEMHVGLGTSIVQALAQQLGASVEIGAAHPGTRVCLTHKQITLVDSPAEDAQDARAVGQGGA